MINKNVVLRRAAPVPRGLRRRVEALLEENYAYMDSPTYRERGIEKQLFTFEVEPALPMTAWYQPTREDVADQLSGTPQLMKGPEERLMFLRFNYAKRRLSLLQKRIRREGLTRE